MTEDTKAILVAITRATDLCQESVRMAVAQNQLLQAVVDATRATYLAYRDMEKAVSAIGKRFGEPEADRAPPGVQRPFRARRPRHLN